jgi:hypothetical protein
MSNATLLYPKVKVVTAWGYLTQIFDINGDTTIASRKRSGDKVTDIRKDSIATTIGRGKRRVGTDERIQSRSNRWFGR